ncbi:MAG: TIM barrel protein [Christensenellaceae bacterium]|nr:TIM barrel protein [Christensenellaceae bacterium]
MEQRIRFGPAGNSDSFYAQGHTSTAEAPAWLHARGLDAFEYSFGHGVRLGEATAAAIRAQAEAQDVQLSVHMPYFINLAVQEDEKKAANIRYFVESLQAARQLGAKRAVFHPGSAAKGDRGEILRRACAFLREILAALDGMGLNDTTLCAETMGKINQLGSLEEVIALCNVDARVWPALDFGHLHCRGLGAIQTKRDYADILDELERGVGLERARTLHVHFSRIEFTKGGEKMHHTFADVQYGPEFYPLGELLAERGYAPVLICESKGTMAEDAAAMRQMYEEALRHTK